MDLKVPTDFFELAHGDCEDHEHEDNDEILEYINSSPKNKNLKQKKIEFASDHFELHPSLINCDFHYKSHLKKHEDDFHKSFVSNHDADLCSQDQVYFGFKGGLNQEAKNFYKRCDQERYHIFGSALNSYLGSGDDSDHSCHHSVCQVNHMIERLDSRGKKMSLQKINIKPAVRFQDPQTRHIFHSFAIINLSNDTYLPTSDL